MYRGISYYDSRFPDHACADLDKIKDAGCTYVVHTFSEQDMMFNAENVAEIVAYTKKIGLEAHVDPWGVAGIFGGETFSYFVTRNHHCLQVKSDGEKASLACINHPDLHKFMYSWIDKAVAIGAEVIFWDEPHFYLPGWFNFKDPMDVWGCRCDICQAEYEKLYNEPMPEEETENVQKFKLHSLIEFLRKMFAYAAKKGVKNTTCMLPVELMRDSGSWEKVASLPHLYGFGTDPYWTSVQQQRVKFDLGEYMRPFCKEVKRLADTYKLRGHIWIQNFSIPEGEEHIITQAVDIARSEGIEDICAWTYFGAKGMASLRSARPQVVWDTLRKAYRQ